jgi:hypothetical protein
VTCIDTPHLNDFSIKLFNDFLFDTPQLIQFIGRSPTSRVLEKAHIILWDEAAYVNFLSQTSGHGDVKVEILCSGLDWQLSSLEQLCTSGLPPFSMSEDLYIYKRPRRSLDWKGTIENGLWVELLRPFTAVKNLYLCEEIAPRIAPAFQELVEGRTTEVLPALQKIFLEGFDSSGPVVEGIILFAAAREVAGHPIAISRWANSKKEMISMYYAV